MGAVVNPIVGAIDVGGVVDRVDVDGVVERIDVNELLERVDIDELVGRIDVNGLLDRVDVDQLVGRIDVDRLLDRVDVNRLMARIEVDDLLAKVDVDELVRRIDVNGLLDRVEVDQLVGRIDVDALLGRADIDALLARVDLDAAVARVDVNAVLERTELGAIVARSTTGVFGQMLDALRAVVLGIDQVVQGAIGRLIRPRRPQGPALPGRPDEVVDIRSLPRGERPVAVQGHHAGSVSRFLAFVLDMFLIGVLFTIGQGLLSLALQVVIGDTWVPSDHRIVVAVSYVLWAFVYYSGLLAASGRTVGMAVLGLLVLRSDGLRLEPRRAALRTMAMPLSFLFFGAGFLIGLVRADRRELHDLIVGTAVVYAWDAELARLRAAASPVPVTA